jgi:glutaredoxin-related protein
LPGKGVIHFPERTLHAVTYDLEQTYDGIYQDIVDIIEDLSLVSFNIEKFRKPTETTKTSGKSKLVQKPSSASSRRSTLKRLESSLHAFETSIKSQANFQRRFYATLRDHQKLLDPASNRKYIGNPKRVGRTIQKRLPL